jgi:hypothetical protein
MYAPAKVSLLLLIVGVALVAPSLAQASTRTGSLENTDPTVTDPSGRLFRSTTSTCAVPKSFPGHVGAMDSYHYDSHAIYNGSNSPACVTVNFDPMTCTAVTHPVWVAAYLNAFNPADISQNYLADIGVSPTGVTAFSFTLPAHGTAVVVVAEVTPGSGCPAYSFTENSPGPGISIADARVLEGDSGTKNMTFDVTLSAPAPVTTTVHFATANGTAVSGADYNQTAGTITFFPGDSLKTFNVPVVGDKLAEADETLLVNLSSPSGGTIVDGQGQGTIVDDDSLRYSTATPSFPGFVAGTADTGNHCDDCSTNIVAPFPVTLYGTSSTAVSVSSNGLLAVGGPAPTNFGNACLPFLGVEQVLAPYWDDQRTDTATGSGIFTSVSGAAPNRVFNIEWRTSNFATPATLSNDYTVRFFENSSNIRVLYSPTMSNGVSATIGLQRTGVGQSTEFSCNTANTLTSTELDFNRAAAPAATTTAASGVTASGATVNASVNPQGQATSVFFQYGPTTAYGSSTATQVLSGSSTLPVSVALGALPSGTTFHFRVVATNATATRLGADQVFTTAVTLAVTKAGSGSGVVTSAPAGIACGATCSAIFATGTSVTLTAAPSTKNSFLGWSGACTGTGPCVLPMTADRAVTATFKAPPACKVPRVVGLKLKKAKARIKKAHCRVGKVRKASSPAKKKGKVIKQSPKPGKKLKNGGKVNLTVGKGP